MAEFRNVVDRSDDRFEHGHRETRVDALSGWTVVPRSDYARAHGPFWFQKTPVRIMAEDMGFETTMARANEFEAASGNDPALWQYLAIASRDDAFGGTPTDEPLKWIMSSLAAEVKALGVRFTDIPRILPAHYLSWFAYAISAGVIDRTFAKPILTELLALDHRPTHDPAARAEFDALVAKPEFKALGASDLETIVDGIIAANPDQFAKAKENPKLVQWFVGQAMKATGGKASATGVIDVVNRRIASA